MTYSFHNFMFPFQWSIEDLSNKTFSEQISLNNIDYGNSTHWQRTTTPTIEQELDDLYNEKNYFYQFVHDALYDNGQDNSLVRHFERREPQQGGVEYLITTGDKTYHLNCFAINLNLYSTGVGVLSFFLYNENYPEPEDVLRINQYGRRLFPPFIGDVSYRNEIAKRIEIKGLFGNKIEYADDFSRYTNRTRSNTPVPFITNLIHEVATNIRIQPVIDDRMYVQCWYKNDAYANRFSGVEYNNFLNSDEWYEFVFVDKFGGITCQNKEMQEVLIKKATYARWQKWNSLYGVSRYSMVYLANSSCPDYLTNYFETMYARMAELVLVQKSSVLRFSAEVTNISNIENGKGFGEKVSSLYKEYIRFVNQIHFREVSAQDQGIELYQLLYTTMDIEKQVEKLDSEIEELYNYVSLREDRKTNNTMSLLTWIATIAVPITVIAAIFGMNNDLFTGDGRPDPKWFNYGLVQISICLILTFALVGVMLIINKKSKHK